MQNQTNESPAIKYKVAITSWKTKYALMTPDSKIATVTTPVFLVGQAIQHYPVEFPQFLRWHLTNMVDVPAITIPLNIAAIAITGRSHPKKSAAFVLSLGIGYKVWEARQLRHSFDYTDVGCFMGGAIAYVAIRKLIFSGKQSKSLRNNAGPQ